MCLLAGRGGGWRPRRPATRRRRPCRRAPRPRTRGNPRPRSWVRTYPHPPMERVLSTEVAGRVGEPVRVAGWLHHQRQLARVAFALVRDRAGIVQVVVEDAAVRAELDALAPQAVLAVAGRRVG